MLKIQVLGKGLIPRGYGLAPKKNPFPADLILIETILKNPGLKVRMMHPDDGHFVDVTTKNVKRLWEAYSDKYTKDPKDGMHVKVSTNIAPVKLVAPKVEQKEEPVVAPTDVLKPQVETPVTEEVKEETKPVESKEEDKQEAKTEEKQDGFKPMTNTNYDNSNKKNKHNNNNNFKPMQNPNNKD